MELFHRAFNLELFNLFHGHFSLYCTFILMLFYTVCLLLLCCVPLCKPPWKPFGV